MCRNRAETIEGYFKTRNALASNISMMAGDAVIADSAQSVYSFIEDQIEEFATEIIEDTLQYRRFDFNFADKVFEYDKELFDKIFRNAITKYFSKIGLETALISVRNVKHFTQAITGYEAIYDQISKISDNSKQIEELLQRVREMIDMSSFHNASEETQNRVLELQEKLNLIK